MFRRDRASRPAACGPFPSGLFSHSIQVLGLFVVASAVLVGCGDSTAPTGTGCVVEGTCSPPVAPPPPPPASPAPPFSGVDYTVFELDPLPGDTQANAEDINDMGQIVGFSSGTSTRETGVLWTIDEAGEVTVRSLGRLPGGTFSRATGINNLGQVVGFADNAAGTRSPFIWTEDGGMQDLGVPDGLLGGQAHKINDQGQIVGAAYVEFASLFDVGRFAIWKVGTDGAVTEIQDLGTLGGQAAAAFDNNELGHVVGAIWFPVSGQTGFIWSEEEGAVQIPLAEGLGMNDMDEVVGQTRPLPFEARPILEPALWSEEGGSTPISDGAGAGRGINNSTQVVGIDSEVNFGQAFIWEDGQLQLLPLSPERDFSVALAINESGFIVGWGTNDFGDEFANLWIPNEQ